MFDCFPTSLTAAIVEGMRAKAPCCSLLHFLSLYCPSSLMNSALCLGDWRTLCREYCAGGRRFRESIEDQLFVVDVFATSKSGNLKSSDHGRSQSSHGLVHKLAGRLRRSTAQRVFDAPPHRLPSSALHLRENGQTNLITRPFTRALHQ